ncbi:MAG: cell filamentation protein Fic, partial [Gammaproteobacteria bacterium]|nr:cell filamentation protein Fic [Gammaproteobacteria bacterium]
MSYVGYEWVRQQLELRVFPLRRPASVGPVSRLTVEGNALQVPASVAPQGDSLLEHLLFAVKHEGINLQVLAQCLPKLPADEMLAAVMAQPSGRYVRVLGFLWETFSQQLLAEQLPV